MCDLHKAELYIANGIIVSYFDGGIKPTVDELRKNWNSHSYKNVTDAELREIINKVERFYI